MSSTCYNPLLYGWFNNAFRFQRTWSFSLKYLSNNWYRDKYLTNLKCAGQSSRRFFHRAFARPSLGEFFRMHVQVLVSSFEISELSLWLLWQKYLSTSWVLSLCSSSLILSCVFSEELVLASWNCFYLAELDEVKLSWILKEGERIRRREPRCAIVWKFTLQTWGRWRGQDWGATGGGWWQKAGCTERRWNQVAVFGESSWLCIKWWYLECWSWMGIQHVENVWWQKVVKFFFTKW